MPLIPLVATAACLTAYVCASIFFLKNPHFLHKKKKIPFDARHISHRGGAAEYLENTMTAFKHAVECGTEMLEIDCHLTKDYQIVVAHDEHLHRIAGVKSHIDKLNFDELPLISEHLCLETRDAFFRQIDDRRIPLLKDVFDAFPDMPINIDVKVDDDKLIEGISELVKTYKREHLTVWGNFRDSICVKCYKHNPNIHLLFSLKRVVFMVLSFYVGILPFIPMKESFFEIIMPNVLLNRKTSLILNGRQRFLIKVVDTLLMRKWMFDHLQRRGIRVYLWVLNTEEDFDRAFSYCVDGIMTDYPTLLKYYLMKNNESSTSPTENVQFLEK